MRQQTFRPDVADCEVRLGCTLGDVDGMLLRLGTGGGGATSNIQTCISIKNYKIHQNFHRFHKETNANAVQFSCKTNGWL